MAQKRSNSGDILPPPAKASKADPFDVMPRSAKAALDHMYAIDMAAKMKTLEVDSEINNSKQFLIRLDGCSFSTFTKGIKKPFDERLSRAMVRTATDLLEKFNAVTAYHQSDEISLVFPQANEETQVQQSSTDQSLSADQKLEMNDTQHPEPITKKEKRLKTHIYNGRIQKLASVTAGYASVRLSFHLCRENWNDLDPLVAARMVNHEAHFDGRIVICNTPKDVMDCLFWRSNFDGLRNAISHISHKHMTTKELYGKSVLVQCRLLKEKYNVDCFLDYGKDILYGTFIKREKYELQGCINQKTGLAVEKKVFRTRIVRGSFNWGDWSEQDRILFTMDKLWKYDTEAIPKATVFDR